MVFRTYNAQIIGVKRISKDEIRQSLESQGQFCAIYFDCTYNTYSAKCYVLIYANSVKLDGVIVSGDSWTTNNTGVSIKGYHHT